MSAEIVILDEFRCNSVPAGQHWGRSRHVDEIVTAQAVMLGEATALPVKVQEILPADAGKGDWDYHTDHSIPD